VETNWVYLGGGKSKEEFGKLVFWIKNEHEEFDLCTEEMGWRSQAVDLLLLPLVNWGTNSVITLPSPLPVHTAASQTRSNKDWKMMEARSPRLCKLSWVRSSLHRPLLHCALFVRS
jgi:hypothetical protein